jgi:UDP-N-acetylbacillosamine N-acetyltransferase
MKKKLFICGSKEHANVISHIAIRCGYSQIEFIDEFDKQYRSINDIKKETGTPIVIAIGNNLIRKKVFNQLETLGFDIVSLIDPSAFLLPEVEIEKGTVILPNVTINIKTKIGKGVILNTSCIIEHENIIEDFVHISPNTALAGNVIVKENTHIGIGSTSIQGITIGKNCTIGAGSVIVKDIPDNVKAFGNPCRVIEELNE